MSLLEKLVHEIHSRFVWQSVGVYVAGSWIALQVVDVVNSTIGLPAWVPAAVLWLLVAGFPVVLATAFVQGRGSAASGAGEAPHEAARTREGPVGGVSTELAGHRLLTWRRAFVAGGAAFALLGLATATYMAMRTLGIGPAGTLVASGRLDEQAVMLLTDFASSDTRLARTATEAIRVDLSQSSAFRLADPASIHPALSRMGLDPTTALDIEVGRQLAEREGLQAVISGEISAAGGRYLLVATITSPSDGRSLTSQRETASDSADLIPAIDRLSEKLRERIGESLRAIRRSPPLPQVTTDNLEALRKYARAVHLRTFEGEVVSEEVFELLQDAVELDTTFAAAWQAIGVELVVRGEEPALMVESFARAHALLDRLTERERQVARANYYHRVAHEPARAAREFERLLELEPENTGWMNGLANLQEELRNGSEALRLYERSAELDPANFVTAINVIRHRTSLGLFRPAAQAVDSARERFGPNVVLDWWRAHLSAAERSLPDAEREVRAIRESVAGDLLVESAVFPTLAALTGALGRLATADSALNAAVQINARRGLPTEVIAVSLQGAWIDLMVRRSPTAAARRLDGALRTYPLDDMAPLDRRYLALAEVYARAGDLEAADRFVEVFTAEVPAELQAVAAADLARARGEVALARGSVAEAVAAFEQSDRGDCVLCALPGLGLAYERAGQPDRAIAAYERYVETPWSDRFEAGLYRHGALLGPILERLAELSDDQGDLERAASHYARLVEMWGAADPELRLRVEAARTRLAEILAEPG